MTLRKDLDSWMQARVEQLPEWHEAMDEPGDTLTLEQSLKIQAGYQGILREAILRLAEEIDRISPA